MPDQSSTHPVSVGKSSYAMDGMGRATAARGSWSGLRALSTARTLQRCSLGGTTPSEVPRVHFYTSAGNEIPARRVSALGGRAYGGVHHMLSRHYFVSQVASLLKFAKETTNPQLAAVLIEKAADLKSQVDESSTTLDPSHVAPDVEPEK